MKVIAMQQPHPASVSRRGMLLSVPPLLVLPHAPKAHAAVATRPVLDQPMRRLRLPQGTMGRDYILLQMRLGDQGPFDFMVDTGLTPELITPHLRQALGIPAANIRLGQGLGAGGAAAQGAEVVQLTNASLVGASQQVQLPPLTAVVTDFVQEHLDPEHDPVEGMLGMDFLVNFDLDLDFPANRLRLYNPGEGVAAADKAGLVQVPAAVLNESGVLGIRATSPNARGNGKGKGGGLQPFVGIIDCGASFSALNWQAAALAGLPPRGDPSYGAQGKPSKGVAIIGVDGKPQLLPTAPVQFTFAGNVSKGGSGGMLSFEAPARGWKPWQPVQAAVGDLPIFEQLLGDGDELFKGPAALIGLDILSQRRVVIGAGVGQKGRARPIYVSKS